MQRPQAAQPNSSSTVLRALRVLDVIAERRGGATAQALADATGVNRVTVHRILKALSEHGLVRQDAPRGPYRLGFGLVALAEEALSESDLVELAQPLLEQLGEQSQETCHLAVLDGAAAVYIAKVESPKSIRLVSRIGRHIPLYSTALGKALLAASDAARAERLIAAQSFLARTTRTIQTPETLREELAIIRERGFAIDRGENEDGVRCVAAPVLGPRGIPEAALSISGPAERIADSKLDDFGAMAVEAARKLSARLGAKNPWP